MCSCKHTFTMSFKIHCVRNIRIKCSDSVEVLKKLQYQTAFSRLNTGTLVPSVFLHFWLVVLETGFVWGWRGQTGRVSEGWSGHQRGGEQVTPRGQRTDSDLFFHSVPAFTGYEKSQLWEGQTWCLLSNRERALFRAAHVLVHRHVCVTPTLTQLVLYTNDNRLLILKWCFILLKAKVCKMVKILNTYTLSF